MSSEEIRYLEQIQKATEDANKKFAERSDLGRMVRFVMTRIENRASHGYHSYVLDLIDSGFMTYICGNPDGSVRAPLLYTYLMRLELFNGFNITIADSDKITISW